MAKHFRKNKAAADLFKQITDNNRSAVFIVDAGGIINYWNRPAGRLYGWSKRRALGSAVDELLPAADFCRPLHKILKAGEPRSWQGKTGCTHKKGHYLALQISLTPLFNRAGALQGVSVSGCDISREEQDLARAGHFNRILLCIRNVNQVIARARTRDRLIQGVCQALVEKEGFFNAWVALVEDGRAVATAYSGFSKSKKARIDKQLKKGQLTACMKKALKSGRLQIIDNPPDECTDCLLAKHYQGCSGMVKQLKYRGRVWGVITVSIPRPYAHDHYARSLFCEVANDISQGLNKIKTEQERQFFAGENNFINRVILKLSRLNNIDKMAACLADAACRLHPGAVAAVTLYDRNADIIRLRAVSGMPEIFKTFRKLAGFAPLKFTVKRSEMNPEQLARFKSGRLEHISGGLYEIAERKIPKTICRQLERISGLKDVYTIGFALQGRPAGGLVLFLPPREKTVYRHFLETVTRFFYSRVKQITAVQETARSEKRYRALLEGITDSVYVLDRNWRHIIVNRAATEFTGMSRKKLLGNSLPELFPGVENTPFFKVFRQVMHSRRPDQVIHEYQFADGRKAYYEVNVYPVAEGILCISRDVTERKQKTERIAALKKRQDKIFATMAEGMVLVNCKGEITYANQRAEEILELEKDIITSRSYKQPEWQHLDLQGKVLPPSRLPVTVTLREQKAVYNMEHGIILPDKRIKWLSVNSAPLFNNRQLTGVVASFRDNTAQKETENRLRQSEENLRITLDSIGDAVIATDIKGRVVSLNRIALKLTGWSFEQARGRRLKEVFRIVNAHTGARTVNPVQKVIKSGKITGLANHTMLLAKDGSTYQIADSAAPIRNDQGRVTGVVMVFRDVTEDYRMREALAASEKKYREIFEASTDGYVFVDGKGYFKDCNQAYREMVGYSVEELRAKNFYEITPSKWHAAEKKALAGVFKGKAAVAVYEKEYCRKDGTVFPVELKVYPQKDKSNRVAGLWAVVRDLTRQRELEEQLRQSQKMEAIGTLAGGIAHDFNNILQIIFGFLAVAKNHTHGNSKLQTALAEIRKAGLRASDLVTQILTFSRKTQKEKQVLLPVPLLKEELKLLRNTIPANIELVHDIAADCCSLWADPMQMHQLVLNLCSNAFLAMETSGGTLTVAMHNCKLEQNLPALFSTLSPGEYIKLTVSDTGCGISTDNIERMFDPFFTTREVGRGTGLGLATVAGIVKDVDGGITVDTMEGRGTAFCVYLPCTGKKPSARSPGFKPAADKHKGKIFIVDDEQAVLNAARAALQSGGYRVDIANDGQHALSYLLEHSSTYDLVITDQMMPGMRGEDLAARLHAAAPSLPILLFTGYDRQVELKQLKSKGIVDVFFKPLELESLIEKIAKIINS